MLYYFSSELSLGKSNARTARKWELVILMYRNLDNHIIYSVDPVSKNGEQPYICRFIQK